MGKTLASSPVQLLRLQIAELQEAGMFEVRARAEKAMRTACGILEDYERRLEALEARR